MKPSSLKKVRNLYEASADSYAHQCSSGIVSWFLVGVCSWLHGRAAGFKVTRCVVEPVDDFPMDAVHLECKKGTNHDN